MNIIDERFKNTILFKDLSVGDVFNIHGDYYVRIKAYNSDGVKWNSLNLTNCDIYFYHDEQPVTKVEADLYIK